MPLWTFSLASHQIVTCEQALCLGKMFTGYQIVVLEAGENLCASRDLFTFQ